jgi:zinc transporter ZupT
LRVDDVGSPLVAIGIGLHNLGEGLAIGAAFALGEAALGTLLIVGFTLHNTTEGLVIIAPIAPPFGGSCGWGLSAAFRLLPALGSAVFSIHRWRPSCSSALVPVPLRR